jgi:protein-S-isoprenylcysteine O-methyltransferase Ste14
MSLDLLESGLRWLGGLVACLTLGAVLFGVWRGTRRPAGRTTGLTGIWLRSPWFYLASTLFFFGIAWWGWRLLPLMLSPQARAWTVGIGSLLFFPGMLFVLWGRLALGRNYFVSTGFGAQLFDGHQLVMNGPYAFVRHPMYLGLMLSALGGLLMYQTWTTLAFTCFAPLMTVRARREEQALSAEFGEQWREYCRRVPAFIPRMGSRLRSDGKISQ